MEHYEYLVDATAEATRDVIMEEVQSIVRAKNNARGVLYGDARQKDNGSIAIDIHMGGTMFRILPRPQMRLDITAEGEGCQVRADFAPAWLDRILYALLVAVSIAAMHSHYVSGSVWRVIVALVGLLLFAASLIMGIYRERYEMNSMLEYLQLSIRDLQERA